MKILKIIFISFFVVFFVGCGEGSVQGIPENSQIGSEQNGGETPPTPPM